MSDACTVSKLHAWNTSNSAAHTHNYAQLCGCKHPEHRSNAEEIITVRTRPTTLSSQESGRTELQRLRQEEERNKQEGTKNTHARTHLVQTNAIGLMKDKIQSPAVTIKLSLSVKMVHFILRQPCVAYIIMWLTQQSQPLSFSLIFPNRFWLMSASVPAPPLPILLAHPSDTLPPFSVHYSASPHF